MKETSRVEVNYSSDQYFAQYPSLREYRRPEPLRYLLGETDMNSVGGGEPLAIEAQQDLFQKVRGGAISRAN